MPYRLPPLSSLRLFEAAGRLLSFKLAAEEVGLTPSAVSHGIKGLEDWLGVALFARNPGGLALTGAGAAYLPRVRAALDALAAATDAVPGRRPSGRLSVSVAPSFGIRWLIPHLHRFNDRHPGIAVAVDTAHRRVDLPRDDVDLAIRMGPDAAPPGAAASLVGEALVPVAAPEVAASVRTAADLADQTLLHVTSVSEDWAAWARLAGIDLPDSASGLRFDTIDLALQAAAQGLGLAIGRLPLVADDLAAGRLVAVLGPPRPARTAYWLMAGRDALARPEVAAFRDWICAEWRGHEGCYRPT